MDLVLVTDKRDAVPFDVCRERIESLSHPKYRRRDERRRQKEANKASAWATQRQERASSSTRYSIKNIRVCKENIRKYLWGNDCIYSFDILMLIII